MPAKRPARIALSLLGPPRIEAGGRAVGFDTRKALAIVAYLAVTRGPQSRERLAAILWPESDPERAREVLPAPTQTMVGAR